MNTTILNVIKRCPVKCCLVGVCIFLLLGLELKERFSPMPARQWNINNLKKIHVPDSETFSFAVFGDNKNSKDVFENLLKLIDHDQDIAFAVSLGDMVQSGNKQRYRWFLQQVRANLGISLLTIVGNDELKGEGFSLYRNVFGPDYYAFGIGSSYFIVLDDADQKGLDPQQEEWFTKELEKSQDRHLRIVFMNIPLYDPRGGDHHLCLPAAYSAKFMNLIKKYHVTHIFSSYIHGFYAGRWQEVPYTITAGAGAELNGADPGHGAFHFLKVNVSNGSVHVEERQVPYKPYKDMGPIGYLAGLYLSSFCRFHGIETLLILIAAGLLVVVYRSELRATRMMHSNSFH